MSTDGGSVASARATSVRQEHEGVARSNLTMGHLAWATDIHLDHLKGGEVSIREFAQALIDGEPDAVLLTGDITVANRLIIDLEALMGTVRCPLYVVLGNHDYYGSSIASVRAVLQAMCVEQARLQYLPLAGVIELSESTALLGVDGWGDARCGAWESSRVRLSDFTLIDDLSELAFGEPLIATLRELGKAEAVRARELLEQALPRYKRIVFATHIPPFEAACWYEGELPAPNDQWSPYFVCVAVGEVLREYAERFPTHDFEVYCGHTHGAGRSEICSNLVVHSADAEYGKPVRAGVIPY